MPTGYTAGVATGKMTDFCEYALTCARAFGACIMLRDEPLSADIPEFEPSDYHANALIKAQSELTEMQSATDEQLREMHAKHIAESVEYHKRCIEENRVQRERYNAMLEKAMKFKAPTPEHEHYAKFLVDQLVESIKFDCNGTYHEEQLQKAKVSFEQWKQERLDRLLHDIDWHTTKHAEELQRTESRNAWVSALKNALNNELAEGGR